MEALALALALALVLENGGKERCGQLSGWRGRGRPNLSRETKFSVVNKEKGKTKFVLNSDKEDWQPYRLINVLLDMMSMDRPQRSMST